MNGTRGNGGSGSFPFDEGMCERYLFGELTEVEQEVFETAYFNDDAFFNRFMAVKDELLDLYSRNELEPEKRRRMEPHFKLTAPRRKRLSESAEFVRSVTLLASKSVEPVIPETANHSNATLFDGLKKLFTMPRLATIGGLAVIIAISVWMVLRPEVHEQVATPGEEPTASVSPLPGSEVASENGASGGNTTASSSNGTEPKRSGDSDVAIKPDITPSAGTPRVPRRSIDPPQTQIPRDDPPRQSVAQNPKRPEPNPELAAETESVTLSSTSRSVTDGNTAKLNAATRRVAIRLLFSGEAYPSYSVRVTSLDGGSIWRALNLKAEVNKGGKSLTVTVPAASLSKKDYIVILGGRSTGGKTETIGEYYLHVDRQ